MLRECLRQTFGFFGAFSLMLLFFLDVALDLKRPRLPGQR